MNILELLGKTNPMMNFFLILSGISAGILNGFIGSGGGIILIFAMTAFAFLPHNVDAVKTRFATAVASILPMSAVSIYFYIKKGAVVFSDVNEFLLPAAVGGILGAVLMAKISAKTLRLIFSALMIWAGIRII